MKYLKLFENITSNFITKLEEVLKTKKYTNLHTDQGGSGSPDTFVTPDWPVSGIDSVSPRLFDVEELVENNRTKNMIYALNSWLSIRSETIIEDWDYLDKIIDDVIDKEELGKIARKYIQSELLKEIEKDSELYFKFKAYLDDKIVVPDWIKRGYNAGLLNTDIKK